MLADSPLADSRMVLADSRMLLYSHDNFGLGHLRRCRVIAHALVERFETMRVLIISGSACGDAFEFHDRVEYLQIPSIVRLLQDDHATIIRLMSGLYAPHRDTDLHKVLQRRVDTLLNAAKHFQPTIFYADYSPLGLRGELIPTLEYLKTQDTTLVLGFRDVLDSPQKLKSEWGHLNDLYRAVEFYDAVWVFGPQDFYNPLVGIDAPRVLHQRITYTGFLHRFIPSSLSPAHNAYPPNALLITAGGGGDGARLFHQVIDAYACDPILTYPAILVLGPLMHPLKREEIHRRAANHPSLLLIDFEPNFEPIIQSAVGVVGMGGYNTFCEILSFDKRAIIVPRMLAREEQLIRGRRAAELGLVDVLLPDECDDAAFLARALRGLPERRRPSECSYHCLLNGLEVVGDLVERLLGRAQPQRPKLAHVDSGVFLSDMGGTK
ncbi:Membrane protein [Mycena venus]|uniref:UDP-N-acetylglucosamine transferase subunit ALG13 n=1 Tax=Mycena venus TaxID=2733690 RepID=A0A8H6YQ36_9AGAR|nr:Membrane protein [Mycena venus]